MQYLHLKITNVGASPSFPAKAKIQHGIERQLSAQGALSPEACNMLLVAPHVTQYQSFYREIEGRALATLTR